MTLSSKTSRRCRAPGRQCRSRTAAKRPDDHIKDWVLIVEKDRMTARDRDDTLDESTFKIDPSKKPAAITITYLSGSDKGKVLQGIYAVEGDSLKICVSFNEKETPKEFVSKAGTDQTLVVLKRAQGRQVTFSPLPGKERDGREKGTER
jgi:uncharacterized protein (TIGR03067 family)